MSTALHSCVVTGLGAVSALGHGCDALWDAICAGRDGMRPVKRFSTDELTVHLGAEVPDGAGPEVEGSRVVAYGLAAAREAWDQARGSFAGLAPERIALVMGTSLGHHRSGLHRPAEEIAEALAIGGPCLTISTACASSTNALGLGRDLLASGAADLVLAGGADELSPKLFAGFHALGVLSPQKCAPFSEPPGTTMGEGAGFLVLETAAQARRRQVEPLAAISGYGISGDAFHETSPDPTGAGVARAIRAALADAGLTPDEIGYVNAHGTGTAASDPAEWRALGLVFDDPTRPAVSSTKSFLGHAQGAAGALEAIATILAMRRQQVLPTLRFVGPRHGCPGDPVAGDRPRPWKYSHAVSTNSAFGGANAAVVVSLVEQPLRPDPPPPPTTTTRRAVRVLGVGAVGAHGTDLADLALALERGEPLDGRVPAFGIEKLVRGLDPRGMDPATRYLTAAAARALADAGIRVRGKLRERTGIVVGATSVSTASAREFLGSIRERGLARLSATAFARMVLNAPAGASAMHLSLKGPLSTLTVGQGSGLVAVAYAAHLLSTRRDADLLISGGFDELGNASLHGLVETDEVGPFGEGEGAGCLLLGAGDLAAHGQAPAESQSPAVDLSGWGLAGPGRPDLAVDQALSMAGRGVEDIDLLFGHTDEVTLEAALGRRWPGPRWRDPAPVLGLAPAATSAQACVWAALALRQREARTALVLSAGKGAASGALILTRGDTPDAP